MKKLKRLYKAELIPIVYKKILEFGKINSQNMLERLAITWCEKFISIHQNTSKVCILIGEGHKAHLAKHIIAILRQNNISVIECNDILNRINEIDVTNVDVIIDAIWDNDIDGNYSSIISETIEFVNILNLKHKIISIDTPSGMSINNMLKSMSILKVNKCICLLMPRLPLLMSESSAYNNGFQIATHIDIEKIYQDIETPYYFTTEESIKANLPQPNRFAHKGNNGHGVIIAGSYGMMGAACLCARAAINSGIGLLTTHVPGCGDNVIYNSIPESIVSIDTSQNYFTQIVLTKNIQAFALGPGLGQNQQTIQGVQKILFGNTLPCIIDADGLNILSKTDMLKNYIGPNTLLTPHVGEFERFIGKCVNSFERLTKLCTFASQYQTTVLLKGAYSTVVDRNGNCVFNIGGTEAMAKGGSGDVLTGIIVALLAQGFTTHHAAICGMFAHARAGELAELHYGKRGSSSMDLAKYVKYVWCELEQ